MKEQKKEKHTYGLEPSLPVLTVPPPCCSSHVCVVVGIVIVSVDIGLVIGFIAGGIGVVIV